MTWMGWAMIWLRGIELGLYLADPPPDDVVVRARRHELYVRDGACSLLLGADGFAAVGEIGKRPVTVRVGRAVDAGALLVLLREPGARAMAAAGGIVLPGGLVLRAV